GLDCRALSIDETRRLANDPVVHDWATRELEQSPRDFLGKISEHRITQLFQGRPPGEGSASADTSPIASNGAQIQYFNWATDGGLLASDLTQLEHMDAYGKNKRQLVSDPTAGILNLWSCGAYIVFPWAFHDNANFPSIYRVNADGSHPVKLADENFESFPVCSANQNWVYFFPNVRELGRVPLDGSGPAEAT